MMGLASFGTQVDVRQEDRADLLHGHAVADSATTSLFCLGQRAFRILFSMRAASQGNISVSLLFYCEFITK
jgi:hypothetical protein